MSKVLRLPRRYIDITNCLALLHLSREVGLRLNHQNTRFPLRLPATKSAHQVQNRFPKAPHLERASVKHRPAASFSRDPAQRNCIWRSQNGTFQRTRAAKTHRLTVGTAVWTHCLEKKSGDTRGFGWKAVVSDSCGWVCCKHEGVM